MNTLGTNSGGLMAITRTISPNINRCELTHISREPIDIVTAQQQHADYIAKLKELGVQVIELAAEADYPDSVFVEDPALAYDELAVITRPGAASRRGERYSIAQALSPYRELYFINPPGLLDGGDVFCVGRRIFVGLSSRSNQAAVEQLCAFTAPFGYSVEALAVKDCLHLKSAACPIGHNSVLINPKWLSANDFPGMDVVEIDSGEDMAANTVMVGDRLLFPSAFPKTAATLVGLGYRLELLNASELAKAEGALSCCSLIFSKDV